MTKASVTQVCKEFHSLGPSIENTQRPQEFRRYDSISISLSIQTCTLTCVGRRQAASQHCVNFAASAISSRLSISSSSGNCCCFGPLSTALWQWHTGWPASWPILSVQNTAARLVFRLRRSDYIADALVSIHWLRVSERIIFKIVMQTYQALHGDAHSIYGSSHRSPTSDLNKDCMRSSFSDDILVPAIRLPWMLRIPCRRRSCINDLPVDVTSAPSLHTFRKRLKLHLLDFLVLAKSLFLTRSGTSTRQASGDCHASAASSCGQTSSY